MAHQPWNMHFHLGNNKPLKDIDLGDAWAGETIMKQVHIKNNETRLIFDITYIPDNDEMKVSGPSSIKPYESLPVDITWTPSVASFGLKATIHVMGVIRYTP